MKYDLTLSFKLGDEYIKFTSKLKFYYLNINNIIINVQILVKTLNHFDQRKFSCIYRINYLNTMDKMKLKLINHFLFTDIIGE